MSNLITQAELLEIVPELRAMVAAESSEKAREALNRLIDRYAAKMNGGSRLAATTLAPRQPRRCAASVY
jgi:hypothetical protein